MSAARSGNDVALSWTAEPGAVEYRIYRGTAPYFTPPLGSPYATTTGLSYTDVGVVGDPAVNHYYVVTAWNGSLEAVCNRRAGEFDFALPGGVDYLEDLGVPLDLAPAITDADTFADAIDPVHVRQALQWEPLSQTFLAWSNEAGFGDNFAVRPGDYVFVVVDGNAPTVARFVGLAPPAGSVQPDLVAGTPTDCALNFFALPLDRPDITNADQLSDSFGAVAQALDWDSSAQVLLAWSNEFGFGDLFPTAMGYPYGLCTGLPPDPQTVAPPLDRSVATDLASATEFLYTGDNPIQTGVISGTIDRVRVAVLRGRTLTRDGQPLSGVEITILDHPEFGETWSRADGMFDMAVNGGGLLTIHYEKPGFLPVQRQMDAPWGDYTLLPDVVLIPLDAPVTTIDLNSSTPIQVAQGSVISDTDGVRQQALFFPAGTTAYMTLPNGVTQTLTVLNVRATEYTVGATGQQAMPAELPANSGYTYAVEFSIDEAMAAGATDVAFSQPVIAYNENFIGFPVGQIVPVGYYDRDSGEWVASPNGRVIRILSVTGGLADLDINGNGQPATPQELAALGVTDAERAQLAALYPVGQELWRVPLTHFSPWDSNWPFGPPPDATGPNQPPPDDPDLDDPCDQSGSIIACQNQALGEVVNVTGTGFRLHYQSDRAPGRRAAYTVRIPISGPSVPPSLERIVLNITVAGRLFVQTYTPQPNLTATFTWDGLDAYGRVVQGKQPIVVEIIYDYPLTYLQGSSWGAAFAQFSQSNVPLVVNTNRAGVSTTQLWIGTIGAWDNRASGLGGWSLDVHHSYVPFARELYLGDGGRRSDQALSEIITTAVAGLAFQSPRDVAAGPDGSVYFSEVNPPRVRRLAADGAVTTVAGTGAACSPPTAPCGDGGPATQASFQYPRFVAVGLDGELYISDWGANRVRRVAQDGIITTVAGTGINSFGGDGGPATAAHIRLPHGVAVAPDGTFYLVDNWNARIRRVRPPLPGMSFGYVLPSEDGSEAYVFDGLGRHLRTHHALTGAVRYQFSYDSAGRLAAVTDEDGNVTTIERDANGNPTAIVAPGGQRTTLTVDANGFLASVANPAGETTQFSYTPDGLLTGLTDRRGNAYSFEYDAMGYLTRDENPGGGVKTLTRIETTNAYTVTVTTALSRTTSYRVERLATGDRRYVVTFPNGLRTQLLVQTNGTQVVTYPDGSVITQTLGPDPRWGMLAPALTTVTQRMPSGLTRTITGQQLETLADPNDPFSLQVMTQTMTMNGRTSTNVYNAATRTITYRTAAGRQGITTLDNQGRVVQMQIAGLAPAQFTYDAQGQLVQVAQGILTSTLAYNTQRELINITQPLSQTIGYGYDLAGRVITQTLPDGREITFAYDANGNVTALSPPGRPDHAFTYTPLNLVEDYIPPDVGAGTNLTHYTYNLDRQLILITRPDGATVGLGYDAAGRLITVNSPQGTISTAYDPVTGRISTITAPGGITVTYAYDGRLARDIAWSGVISGSIHRSYDNDFRITSETINGGNGVSFGYDLDGLLTQAGTLTLSRNPQNGLPIGSALGTVTDTLSYDAFGEIAAYQAATGGAPLFAVQYARDSLGRITQQTETVGGVTHVYTYTYDLTGRLAQVWRDSSLLSQYSYDANGNRLSYISPSGTTTGTYDDQDRLLVYGTNVYTYTANGELQSKSDTATNETTTYVYDALGNLRAVTLPDGTQIAYLIDGSNRRVGKRVNGVLVQGFLYQDQLNPMAELDGNNNVVSRFAYASQGNVPDLMIKNGITYRIIADHLGSPRLVVDVTTDAVAQRLDYDEFGNVITDTNPGFQPFGFAGGLYDRDTGLVRFGARDYDAETGRWTAKDPLGFRGGDTDLYVYALNDPLNNVDPSGRQVELCKRVADLPVAEQFGLTHHWIRTRTMERGLGPAGGGLPPGAGGQGSPDPIQDTELTDHTGQGDLPISTCKEVPNVDEDCVNRELSDTGSKGYWTPWNQCQSVAADILAKCRTPPPAPPSPLPPPFPLAGWGEAEGEEGAN